MSAMGMNKMAMDRESTQTNMKRTSMFVRAKAKSINQASLRKNIELTKSFYEIREGILRTVYSFYYERTTSLL
jgi:hypothetical protein